MRVELLAEGGVGRVVGGGRGELGDEGQAGVAGGGGGGEDGPQEGVSNDVGCGHDDAEQWSASAHG